MSSFNCCTFVLFLLSTYVMCDCSKMVEKKVDSLKERNMEQYRPEQQISHTTESAALKRSQRDLSSSEYKDLSDIIDDLDDNALTQTLQGQSPEAYFDNMPPLVYYLLLQKLKQLQANEPTYRVRTPRLGRSIDFRRLDATFGRGSDVVDDGGNVGTDNMQRQSQFVSRLIKKSVPFKPRLGKRNQQAMLCD